MPLPTAAHDIARTATGQRCFRIVYSTLGLLFPFVLSFGVFGFLAILMYTKKVK